MEAIDFLVDVGSPAALDRVVVLSIAQRAPGTGASQSLLRGVGGVAVEVTDSGSAVPARENALSPAGRENR